MPTLVGAGVVAAAPGADLPQVAVASGDEVLVLLVGAQHQRGHPGALRLLLLALVIQAVLDAHQRAAEEGGLPGEGAHRRSLSQQQRVAVVALEALRCPRESGTRRCQQPAMSSS